MWHNTGLWIINNINWLNLLMLALCLMIACFRNALKMLKMLFFCYARRLSNQLSVNAIRRCSHSGESC